VTVGPLGQYSFGAPETPSFIFFKAQSVLYFELKKIPRLIDGYKLDRLNKVGWREIIKAIGGGGGSWKNF
jgi:hypothetical protein